MKTAEMGGGTWRRGEARAYRADQLVLQGRVDAQTVHLGHQEERVFLVVRVLQPVREGVHQQQAHGAPVQHHAVIPAPREAARGHATLGTLPQDLA